MGLGTDPVREGRMSPGAGQRPDIGRLGRLLSWEGPRPSPDIAGETRRPDPHRGWIPRERYGPALRIRSASSGWHAPGCTERRGIERPGAPRPSLTGGAPDPVPFHAKAPRASRDPGRAALALDAVVAPDLQDGGRPAAGRNYPHLPGPGLPDPRDAPLQVHPLPKQRRDTAPAHAGMDADANQQEVANRRFVETERGQIDSANAMSAQKNMLRRLGRFSCSA